LSLLIQVVFVADLVLLQDLDGFLLNLGVNLNNFSVVLLIHLPLMFEILRLLVFFFVDLLSKLFHSLLVHFGLLLLQEIVSVVETHLLLMFILVSLSLYGLETFFFWRSHF